MLKKKLLLFFAVQLMAIQAFAYELEVDGIYYNILSKHDMTLQVTYASALYDSYSGDVVIPASVTIGREKYAVTSIGQFAFRSCRGLTSVVIPNSVTSIGKLAFADCKDLTRVELPKSVTVIGNSAFSMCI